MPLNATIAHSPRRRLLGVCVFFLYALSFLACISLLFINKSPLFYYDTGAYLAHGDKILAFMRSLLELIWTIQPSGNSGSSVAGDDNVVVASRSATYAIFLAALNDAFGIFSVAFAQTAAFLLAVWLAVRVTARQDARNVCVPCRVFICTLAACLGSAPFHTVYLMPDIFTPILILVFAVFAIFAGSLRRWEFACALILGGAAVTAHPSNLLIALLLVGAAVIIALLWRQSRAWMGVLAMIGIIGIGLAERTVFTVTAASVGKADVIYLPYLTVRSIVDGPGYKRLAERCPQEELASCTLYEMLRENPERIDASRMMFDRSDRFGSFARLPRDLQERIANEQWSFLTDVAKHYPVGVTLALLNNAADQLATFSIIMTLPIDPMLDRMGSMTANVPEVLKHSELRKVPAWLPLVEHVHQEVYGLAAGLCLVLVLLPWNRPFLNIRLFVAMIAIGILANAIICGGVSQPAERYGSRVIFLVPMSALILLYALRPGFLLSYFIAATPRRGRHYANPRRELRRMQQ